MQNQRYAQLRTYQRVHEGVPLRAYKGSVRCRNQKVTCRAELQQQLNNPDCKDAAPSRKTVVSIGESLFDLIADQQGYPRELVESWTPFAGGAPANVATSLAKLGLNVLLITALGRDAPGDKLYHLFKDSGVRLEGIQRRDEPTREVFVTRDRKGDRQFAGFALPSENYCDAHLDANALPIDEIKSAAWLVTGTLGLAYPASREAIWKAVRAAKEGGCKVLVDVNWRPVFWQDPEAAKKEVEAFLQLADVIKVSDADILWYSDISPEKCLNMPNMLSEVFPKATGVLITAGGNGAAYSFKTTKGEGRSGSNPVFDVNVIDTTGAGDAFTAAFLYKVLQAESLEALVAESKAIKEAVVFASAAGALITTRKGAIEGQPKLEEVEQMFESSKSSKNWDGFWGPDSGDAR